MNRRQVAAKILNVAEKNDAAKSISAILSRGRSVLREGQSPYNKIYCFPYAFRGNQVDMAFTSVSGHLTNLDFSEQFRRWDLGTCADLFAAPVVTKVQGTGIPIKVMAEIPAVAVSHLLNKMSRVFGVPLKGTPVLLIRMFLWAEQPSHS